MALKPRDLRLNDAEFESANAIESLIDKWLQKAYAPGQEQYLIDMPETFDGNHRVICEIIYRYKSGQGWSFVAFSPSENAFRFSV